MVYYTGDRSGLLSQGMTFNLQNPPHEITQCTQITNLCSSGDIGGYFQSNFPSGISRHGVEYLLRNNNYLYDQNSTPLPYTNLSSSIEVIYEFVRQTKFPELPSRFTCAFAFETSKQPRIFFKNPTLPVYEISGNARIFKGDMTLLKIGPNHISTLVMAEKYWSGQIIDPTTVEILIECPALIGNRVL